jgi:DNA-binding YbaB/EbfC family protein
VAFNPRDLLKQVQELQAKMSEMQERLRDVRVTGTAGGEMVRIELDGQFTVRGVSIAPEAVDPSDVRMLEDLVRAAFSDAVSRLRERLREETTALTGGMGIPPGMLGL